MKDLSTRRYQFLFIVGLAALSIGVAVYVLDRPADATYFVPDRVSLFTGQSLFGVLGNYLPTFLHAFAFCLMSVAVLKGNARIALLVCLFWLLVDSFFELAQHRDISPIIIGVIPDWFAHVPILENAKSYFQYGYFDKGDLLSILLGIFSAFILIVLFVGKTKPFAAQYKSKKHRPKKTWGDANHEF